MPLPNWPVNKSIVGIGLSDWSEYATRLTAKFSYTNTYFHMEPQLDIANLPPERRSSCDFLISSDVFEHVVPPAQKAFRGAFDVLKPGGHLIFTVPFTNQETTDEHYPELHNYRIVQFGSEYVVLNRTADGRYVVHEHPIFHGGPGTTLEMRIFCERDVIEQLRIVGFDAEVIRQDIPDWGILFHGRPWSLPILARKPTP